MTNRFSAHERGLFWCLFPELRNNDGNEYQNNTRVSAETVCQYSTYIILFLTRHNESINDYENDELYTSSPFRTRSVFEFCWWRHTRLLMTSEWPASCDALTWIVISNSLDIEFIHGDIHDRSCKKCKFSITSLCNPRDHCTHSLCQDCYTVELITSNLPTYLHMGTTLWLGVVLYALVPETMHGIIVGKRVRTRQLSDRYCTRVWMSGMFWCDQ